MDCRTLLSTALGLAAMAVVAQAGDFSNATTYNTPFGMSQAQENQPIDPSLRDANGNLNLVNGQFTSSPMAQSFAQGSATSSAFASGVGNGGAGAAFGGATAIGNQLNVITTGSNNTVVVNSQQTNNGNITATTSVNGGH